jgi:hypothetical protein
LNLSVIHKGILLTPNLWKESAIEGILQIEINDYSFKLDSISAKLRLGMFVEQCIFQSLENNQDIQVLAKNIQIIEKTITLGEIDCILNQNEEHIHLEIAYKFYLFDSKHSQTELNCWIGPNRKDSLVEKIQKIKGKQFPLLYHTQTAEKLSELAISIENIQQKVCFKAQLFVPYLFKKEIYQFINPECIQGYYYTERQLKELKDQTFFFPQKLEWTVIPHQYVEWMSFDLFTNEITSQLQNERSPMFWSKDKKGNLAKSFAIWWD